MTPVKTVPYIRIISALSLRWAKQEWQVLANDKLLRLIESLRPAIKRCYDFTWWAEAKQIEEVSTTSNTVPWADIQKASRYRVWDAEPYTEGSTAREVSVLPVASGLRLTQRTLTSVWVEFMPEAPDFDDVVAWTAFANYQVGQRVYFQTFNSPYHNRAFECITAHTATVSFAADIANWKELIIYDCMAEAVTLLALADLLGNSEQERLQAADLRNQAEMLLHDAYVRSTVIP